MRYSSFALALAFAATTIAMPQEVSVLEDGQPQAATAVQIADGQIQAPTSTAAAVAQIPDGQLQAPTSTAEAVAQIPDGQLQAPTSTAEAVAQIPDGQIQAPATTTAAGVSQIGDGQIQVGTASSGVPVPSANGTFATSVPSPSPFTGAASLASWSKEIVIGAIGVAAGFALL